MEKDLVRRGSHILRHNSAMIGGFLSISSATLLQQNYEITACALASQMPQCSLEDVNVLLKNYIAANILSYVSHSTVCDSKEL